MSDYEGLPASKVTQLLCKLFVERTLKDQEEIASAAAEIEPTRLGEGYKLSIQNGMWVREVNTPTIG